MRTLYAEYEAYATITDDTDRRMGRMKKRMKKRMKDEG